LFEECGHLGVVDDLVAGLVQAAEAGGEGGVAGVVEGVERKDVD